MANSSDENKAVLCPATLKLGELHWYILRASDLMYNKTTIEIKLREGKLSPIRQEHTDFGKEVGRDEINWWVFKKEPDIEELKKQTTRALEVTQKLKEASKLLSSKRAVTYPELLETLRNFAEKHEQEIDTLYQYVRWLNSRDPLAPTILFTYRVWGSTRMSDRTSKLDQNEAEPEAETVKRLTEIVLGLVNTLGTPVLSTAEYDIGSEIYESAAYDEESASEIKIPMDRVVRLASRLAFEECGEYFEMVRDSLRNILLDVDKFIEQRDFVNDDAFWQSFIKKATQTVKAENLLWDFKETLTMWHTGAKPETEQAKVAFAEDVASFANAHGGVLVIGVTDKREIVGIGSGRELENRLKFTSDVLSKHVEYSREIVRPRQIVLPDKDGNPKVCLVVVIADACEPVGVRDEQGRYTYPIRRESGLTRVSREEVFEPKMHRKNDNYDFLRELYQFVHEK
jgi:hypothetical protein